MISYNPKEWFTYIIHFHKADTLRLLTPHILAIAFYTFIVAVIDIHILNIGADSVASKIVMMHNILGFVISMLLVFRTNTAYDRWWEGRKLWGALVNCSRNLAIKIKHIVPATKHSEFRDLIVAFPFALKNHLRNVSSMNEGELMETFHILELKDVKHVPLKLTSSLYEKILAHNKEGKINSEQLLILNQEVQQWMEICGACERIRNTPIPFSYSVFLKKFIFIFVTTLPIAYVPQLGYYAIPIVVFVFYVLASLELIAEEIEDPFGNDPNDLPLDEISRNIKKSVELVFRD